MIEKEKYFVIFNPAAGGGRLTKRVEKILKNLQPFGITVELQKTKRRGDAICLVKDAYSQGWRNFLAIGGDGTVFEVVNGLFPIAQKVGEKPTLGLIPIGTGNSFLKDFTPDGINDSTLAIAKGRRYPCDVVELIHQDGSLYFVNLLSFGFVAEVAAKRNKNYGNLGELGYVLSVIFETARLHSYIFPMKVDSLEENRDPVIFISINNTRFTGGKMMMAPNANPSDGRVDLIQVYPLGRIELLRAFPKIFSGKHVDLPQVKMSQVQSIEFNFEHAVNVMVDGESLRLIPKHLRVLPNVLEIKA